MPKNSKRGSGKFKIGAKLLDVTLNDYANSAIHGQRMKKSKTNAIEREVKELCSGIENDIAWYDKDLDEFDVDACAGYQSGDQTEVCDKETRHAKPKSKKKNKRPEEKVENEDKRIDYPLDVWYLISEYIKPEDISVFARICRSSHIVVNSPKFWFYLYKRHYNEEVKLPARLQPECMQRPHSLRACVIRALFHMYPPFIERIRSRAPFESDAHGLVSWRCTLMWHRKNRSVWDFYFKFNRGDDVTSGCPSERRKQPDLLEMLDDVHANIENGCKVMQITCLNFVSTPAVMGMYLASVSLNVGHKMHHHKLRLGFSSTSYRRPGRGQDASNLTITFDPVSNIRVLDWWHPQYPCYDELH